MRRTTLSLLALVLVTGCGGSSEQAASTTSPASTSSSTTPTTTTTTTSPTTTTTKPKPAKPKTTTPKPPKATTRKAPAKPASTALTSLKGNTRNAIAWAPLSNPSAVTIEGSVPSARAWSTSKVLVVAAYLDTVVNGDPAKIPSKERGWIKSALTASDGAAIVNIRNKIPGSPGAAIERVLREIGDTTTRAPDTSQGTMQWSVRQQIRFMAALAAGKVVSAKASSFLLGQMHPISAHRWGLGTIGAGSFKGGWLRSNTETRQMGIVGGYAVAIITAGDGPAVVQTDGDSAHVWQMNRLATLLAKRIR